MKTETEAASPAPVLKSNGRSWLWLGLLLCVLPIAAYVIQFNVLQRMFVPWYIPILATVGAACVVVSVIRRRTWPRWTALALVALLGGFEWLMLGAAVRLPEYAGPAHAGAKLPTFSTATAAGEVFANRDLEQGVATVLVFYRGRW
ncbi:MAG: hypothetical protein SGJ19_18200 [Planctomycetia bacterium]|nr:hypothetical protein [Planctomycetia bacterium]